jgi:hypothetical protein
VLDPVRAHDDREYVFGTSYTGTTHPTDSLTWTLAMSWSATLRR